MGPIYFINDFSDRIHDKKNVRKCTAKKALLLSGLPLGASIDTYSRTLVGVGMGSGSRL